MKELASQLILAGGLWTVIGTVVVALLYRSKTAAETQTMQNKAAQIADETFTRRVQNLKGELFDALGMSEERRRVMAKMDTAINVMRFRMQRHGNWDHKVKEAVDELCEKLRDLGVDVTVDLDEPPPLNFDDIDFDFRIVPPSPAIVAEIAQQRGIDTD